MEGFNFLKSKYDLHNSDEVESAAERTEVRTNEEVHQEPKAQIQNYLDRFNEILEREDTDTRERGVEAIKKILHSKFVIKPDEIPEGYFDAQRRIAREQGHGDVEIGDTQREQLSEVIITDQESSLDTWIDYLASSDATYPDWLKYYAVRSILGMGEYDKEKKQFSKRSKGTTKPFPDLNREALALVLDAIQKKHEGKIPTTLENLEQEDKTQFEKLLQGENFPKLYAFAIDKCTPASQEQLSHVEGEWIKYDQNSDHIPLVTSLQGHGTGWCTAGESTAQVQLKNGDFYVYYSLDKDGIPSVPRAAIRMEGGSIAEVRGVAADQNLDEYIAPVVVEKMKEFPDGAKYEKKARDMKTLTAIDIKVKADKELTKDDLRFLYEIDHKIEGFGYQKDPRINELVQNRDAKEDLSFALDIPKEKISTTKEEALSGGIEYHYGDIDLDLGSLTLPQSISGYLNLNNLTSAEGLTLPQSIGGFLALGSLTSAEGLTLPQSIGGYLSLSSLRSAEGLTLPKSIGGSLNLNNLTSAEGLTLPQNIGASLDLRSLTTAEGLTLPQSINGALYLNNLTSAEGLTLPQSIGGYLDLDNLTSAEGLTLPQSIGDLNLRNLTSAKGLIFPQSIYGDFNLHNLTTAEGLTLPQSIGGDIDLGSLIDVSPSQDLILPKKVGGDLDLNNLISAKGLIFPLNIGNSLYLNDLQYFGENLMLPQNIGGDLYLSNLTSAEGLTLPQSIGGSLDLRSLTSAEDLRLPENIEGTLSLTNLESTKELVLPKHVGKAIGFENLKTDEIIELKKQYPNLLIIAKNN